MQPGFALGGRLSFDNDVSPSLPVVFAYLLSQRQRAQLPSGPPEKGYFTLVLELYGTKALRVAPMRWELRRRECQCHALEYDVPPRQMRANRQADAASVGLRARGEAPGPEIQFKGQHRSRVLRLVPAAFE